jgi:hypothetical protein
MVKKKVRKTKTKTKTKTKSRSSEKLSREQVTGLLKNLRRIFGPKGKK